jgi:hypothetical protein
MMRNTISTWGLRVALGLLSAGFIYTGIDNAFGGIMTLGWQGLADFAQATNPQQYLVRDSHVRFLGGAYLLMGVTVALTAYNDEDSIRAAVEDFRAHPRVSSVIVVSNNSKDSTFARAVEAGAITFDEKRQGYGHCVHRCFTEALRIADSDLIVLCEGDRTFRAYDLDKLLAYAPHGDIVNGTRTVERLRQYHTQLSTFMYYGNLFVGKLLEAKHLGRSTITDVGTTYKLCRRSALPGNGPGSDHREATRPMHRASSPACVRRARSKWVKSSPVR